VSSSSSGGTDDDSTGLRAALQLITPLLRCASLAKHTCFLARFRDDRVKKRKGEPPGFPFCFPRR